MPQNYIYQHPMFSGPEWQDLPPVLQYGGQGGPNDPFAPYQPTPTPAPVEPPVPPLLEQPLAAPPAGTLLDGGLDYGQPGPSTPGGYFDPMNPADRAVLQSMVDSKPPGWMSAIPYAGPIANAAGPVISALQLGPTADAYAAQQAYNPYGGAGFDVPATNGDPAAQFANLAATGYLGAGPNAAYAANPAQAGHAAAQGQAGNGSVGGVEAAAEAAFGSAADNALGWW